MREGLAAPDLPALAPQERERLDILAAAVLRWNPAINLVSKTSLPAIWTRHIADSLQLLPLAAPGSRHWADLGSGGGFPGLAVAAIAATRCPGLHVTLVEADGRKAAFLREAGRLMEVPVTVHAARIEDLQPLDADVVSARALAPLPRLWAMARRHLAPGGTALFPKGAGHAAEVAALAAEGPIRIDVVPSRTDTAAVILRLYKDPQ